jgi:hypothetical protein
MLGAAATLSGCGFPATPQPPSLKLPAPVTDLHATRSGDTVALSWTMPKEDTSKVALTGDIATRVCREPQASAQCATVAHLSLAPGAKGVFTETLTPELASGSPRPLRYFVELINERGRSAGLSKAAVVPAGQAPAAVLGLRAEVRKDGVALHWAPGAVEPYATQVRLQRTLLNPAPAKKEQGPLAAAPEAATQNLLVPASGVQGGALDKDIRFGESYAYRAQRVTRLTVDGQQMELDGPLSSPVEVEARDVFPPAVPAGLAAVATPAQNGAGASIDLSWEPDAEADVAGYAVYRREVGQAASAWTRISSAQPVTGPGFHDASVEAGKSYEYAVTAIGQNGVESGKSAAAQETVPQG